MNVVHLTASPFFGGPERQMLGLALHLPVAYRSLFLSFPERGLCRPFLAELRRRGFYAEALHHNTPRFRACVAEVADRLESLHADVLCCHGYKADLVGLAAARRVGVPVVAVSRGWTAVSWKVRAYEVADRVSLRFMDAVVCVSEGQARKVLAARVPEAKVRVIRNAINSGRFAPPDPNARRELEAFFPRPPRLIVGAMGRLSPEKGFTHLVDAAAMLARSEADVGFLLIGDGPLRDALAAQIAALGLADRFVLAGFRDDIDRLLPSFDATVLPSYTEGLPNVVLESLAAGVPVVATAVGGTPEVIDEGRTGYLVPPADAARLAAELGELLADDVRRREMGRRGAREIRQRFGFAAQSQRYQDLLDSLTARPPAPRGRAAELAATA